MFFLNFDLISIKIDSLRSFLILYSYPFVYKKTRSPKYPSSNILRNGSLLSLILVSEIPTTSKE